MEARDRPHAGAGTFRTVVSLVLGGLLALPGPALGQADARATRPGNPAAVGVVAPRPPAAPDHQPRARPGRSLTAGRTPLHAPPNVARPPNVGGTVPHLPGPFTRMRFAGRIYFYCLGAFYRTHRDGYERVPAPAGAVVRALPSGAEELEHGGRTIWYRDGVFYEAGRRPGEYVVIPAPLGAVVSRLPEDAVEVRIGGLLHYESGGVYYVPVRRHGELGYVVTRP